MCDFKVLIKNDYGYTAQCFGCNHLEVAFGTSLIRFHLNYLDQFISYLQCVKCKSIVFNNGRKNVLLDIASIDMFQMILTYDELTYLCDLVDKMDEEIKANALLGLFDRE